MGWGQKHEEVFHRAYFTCFSNGGDPKRHGGQFIRFKVGDKLSMKAPRVPE